MPSPQYSDDDLVEMAVEAAKAFDKGAPSPAALSLLKAIASTRSEDERRELARRSAALVPGLTEVGLEILRVAIFALA